MIVEEILLGWDLLRGEFVTRSIVFGVWEVKCNCSWMTDQIDWV